MYLILKFKILSYSKFKLIQFPIFRIIISFLKVKVHYVIIQFYHLILIYSLPFTGHHISNNLLEQYNKLQHKNKCPTHLYIYIPTMLLLQNFLKSNIFIYFSIILVKYLKKSSLRSSLLSAYSTVASKNPCLSPTSYLLPIKL